MTQRFYAQSKAAFVKIEIRSMVRSYVVGALSFGHATQKEEKSGDFLLEITEILGSCCYG